MVLGVLVQSSGATGLVGQHGETGVLTGSQSVDGDEIVGVPPRRRFTFRRVGPRLETGSVRHQEHRSPVLGPSGTGSANSQVLGVQWPWTTSSGNSARSAFAAAARSHQTSIAARTRSGSPRSPFILTAATRVTCIAKSSLSLGQSCSLSN